MVACGLSGPRRPFAGALRDFVLGAKVLDGRGQVLRFGGTVFKNVAGFDAFRLMAGALGSLGVVLEVSLRVAPHPRAEAAVSIPSADLPARRWVANLMRRPTPLSGAFHDGERLHLRLSGGEAAVGAALAELGGRTEDLALWDQIRHLTHPALAGDTLWRLSIPAGVEPHDLPPGRVTWDWGGAQVWLAGDPPADEVFAAAERLGGHATRMRGPGDRAFQPLPPPLLALHRRIKAAMDPQGILNPGVMYEGL
jgi:glycolate oxidase FAD binding subunit